MYALTRNIAPYVVCNVKKQDDNQPAIFKFLIIHIVDDEGDWRLAKRKTPRIYRNYNQYFFSSKYQPIKR